VEEVGMAEKKRGWDRAKAKKTVRKHPKLKRDPWKKKGL
jgi:hypothetical protein